MPDRQPDPTIRDADHPGTAHPDPATLRAHLEDRLPADEAAALDAHLATCTVCLADDEPVTLPAGLVPTLDGTPAAWDERATRRAVRRTLLRTAVDVVAIAGLALVAYVLVAQVAWHLVAIDRGDRVAATVQATLDLPVLLTPGAEVGGWTSSADAFVRTTEVEVGRAVGAVRQDLGTEVSRLGARRARPGVGEPPADGLLGDGADSGVVYDPDRLADGLAVAVHVDLAAGLPLDEVDALAADTDEVTVTWVGFAPDGEERAVGYSACQAPGEHVEDVSGARSVGTSGSPTGALPGVPGGPGAGATHAYEQTIRALEGVADSGLAGAWGFDAEDAARVEATLTGTSPAATSVVLTGSADEVDRILDGVAADAVELLGVAPDVAAPTPCG